MDGAQINVRTLGQSRENGPAMRRSISLCANFERIFQTTSLPLSPTVCIQLKILSPIFCANSDLTIVVVEDSTMMIVYEVWRLPQPNSSREIRTTVSPDKLLSHIHTPSNSRICQSSEGRVPDSGQGGIMRISVRIHAIRSGISFISGTKPVEIRLESTTREYFVQLIHPQDNLETHRERGR